VKTPLTALIALLLTAGSLGLAGTADAGEPLWAGVPLDELAQMGIQAPTLNDLDSGWRAPIEGGGFIQVDIFESVEAAREVFDFRRVAAFQAQLPELDIGGDVPAVGDGHVAVLFVDRNVVVTIRDPSEQATVRAGLIREALDIDHAAQPYDTREVDGERVSWDNYGRRTITPVSE